MSGKKLLRYAQENDRRNDTSASSSEEEEEDSESNKNVNNNYNISNSANLSSSEDEASSEEEAPVPVRKRKSTTANGRGTKKGKVNRQASASAFFDMEADDVDDEDDDEDEVESHYRKQFKKKGAADIERDREREQLDAETKAIMRQQDRRRQAAGGFFTSLEARAARSSAIEEEVDDEESVAHVARTIQERHKQSIRNVDLDARDARPAYATDYSAVSQQSLVPSVSDPGLWMIGCPPGKESELVMQIMNKAVAFALQGKSLGIIGAIASQTKGKIYVESYSEPAVKDAIQGVRGILQYKVRLIPIGDMTTVMTITTKKKPVKKNDWVRLNRGHYKGDLALVIGVKDGGLKCIVQCVPRLDHRLADLTPEEQKVRRKTVRPPAKIFNAGDVSNKNSITRQRFPGMNERYDFYDGNYFHDGYLIKEFNVNTMVKPCSEDSPPTLEELQRFQRTSQKKKNSDFEDIGDDDVENEGSKKASSLLDHLSRMQKNQQAGGNGNGGLMIGDTVEVMEGDLVGMRGKLMSLDGTTVKIKASETLDLGKMAEIEFLIGQVRKYIPPGAHVKVIDGRYANETGTVVAVDDMEGGKDCLAVVLTDMTHKEISVRTSQLQESAEIASGRDKLAGYELHDLVVLSGGGSTNEVGVIVRVGREEFTVINNHGIVREVRPEELRGKRNSTSKRAVALDVQGGQIRVGDNVSVVEGPHKGKSATIKQMNRAQLFLYSQTRAEHAGIFVVRSRSCVLSGSRNRSTTNEASSGLNSRGGGGQRGARRDDTLIGKTVRVSSGKWKGYIGTVADSTATHVQVELHSRLKKVMVLRERIAVVGDKFGSTDRSDHYGSNGMAGSATPFLGGATPMHGSATPRHGSGVTPMHDGGLGGGFTPSHSDGTDDVWRPGSMDQTPRHRDDSETTNGFDEGDPATKMQDTKAPGWGGASVSDVSSTINTWTPNSMVTESPFTSQASQSTPSAVGPSDASVDTSKIERPMSSTTSNRSVPNLQATATAVDSDSDQTGEWYMERVIVELVESGKKGVISEVNKDNSARIEVEETGETVHIKGAKEVKLVEPKENDYVLVTGGVDVGIEGNLVCIDGSEAIIQDANEEYKIVDLMHLAKIIADPDGS